MNNVLTALRRFISKNVMFVALIGLCIILSILSPRFLTFRNFMNIIMQSTTMGIVAVGMTFVIITGGIDLSVGSILAFSAAIGAGAMVKAEWSIPLAIIIMILVSAFFGLAHGLLISRLNLPAFIVTLAGMSIARGFTLVFMQGKTIRGLSEEFQFIGNGQLFGAIPCAALILAVVYIIAHYVLKYTTYGRSVYALGGNKEATALSGINVKKIETIAFVISGITAGLGAVILNARLFVGMRMGIEEACKEQGIKLIQTNADGNIERQAGQIEDLIQQKVQAIIANPVDSDAIVSSQQKIIAAGIPVIYCDRGASSQGYTSFIATDNVAMGALAADKIAEFLSAKYGSARGRVIEVEGLMGTSAARDRGSGFNNRLKEKYPNIQVVARQAGDFNQETSLNVMQNMIQANPQFDAVYGHNDDCILGAMKAIQSAGLLKPAGQSGHIYIIGIDGTADAIAAIKSGSIDVTISQDPIGMGKNAVQLALDVINGKPVKKDIAQPFYVVDSTNYNASTNWGNAAKVN